MATIQTIRDPPHRGPPRAAGILIFRFFRSNCVHLTNVRRNPTTEHLCMLEMRRLWHVVFQSVEPNRAGRTGHRRRRLSCPPFAGRLPLPPPVAQFCDGARPASLALPGLAGETVSFAAHAGVFVRGAWTAPDANEKILHLLSSPFLPQKNQVFHFERPAPWSDWGENWSTLICFIWKI